MCRWASDAKCRHDTTNNPGARNKTGLWVSGFGKARFFFLEMTCLGSSFFRGGFADLAHPER